MSMRFWHAYPTLDRWRFKLKVRKLKLVDLNLKLYKSLPRGRPSPINTFAEGSQEPNTLGVPPPCGRRLILLYILLHHSPLFILTQEPLLVIFFFIHLDENGNFDRITTTYRRQIPRSPCYLRLRPIWYHALSS